jgi:dUTP pyrophosphatase
VTVLNAPGTVDSDYRGPVGVILVNFGDAPFVVHRGDRIAQAVLARVEAQVLSPADSLSGTERGGGGFGHTGI